MENLSTEEKEKFIKQISELQSKLDTQNSYINYANQNLERLQREIKDLNAKQEESVSKLKLAEETNAQLQSQIAILQQSLTDMENSHSWKLTKPLRAIKWWLWRIFRKGKV